VPYSLQYGSVAICRSTRDSLSNRQTERVGALRWRVKVRPAMEHRDGAIVYIYHLLIPRTLLIEPESEAAWSRSSSRHQRLRMLAR
jgi:hypothetical protein